MDIAQLGIKISSGEAVDAARALGGFAVAAERADAANTKLGKGSKAAAAEKRRLAAEAKAAAAALSAAEKQEAQAAREAAKAQEALDRSMRSTAMQSKQLSFQLNDVFTSLAGGMNPMMVAMQQGSQFSQVFNEMGSKANVIKGLGAAFMSVISPASLATLAVIGLGGAIVQWMIDGVDAVKTFEDQLSNVDASIAKLQKSTEIYSLEGIGGLIEKYGEINTELLVHIERMREIEKLEGLRSFADAIKSLKGEMTGGWLTTDVDDLRNAFNTTNDQARYMLSLIEQINSAKTFDEQADAVIALRKAINDATGGFENATGAAKDLSDKVETAFGKVLELRHAAPDANWMDAALDGINSLTGGIWNAIAAMGTLNQKQVQAAMWSRSTISPEIMLNYSQYGQGQAGMINAVNDDRPLYGGNGDGLTAEQYSAMHPAPKRVRGGGGRGGKSDAERAAEKAIKDKEALAKKYDDLVSNQNQYIEKTQLEASTIGMTEVEADKMMRTQELLNKATDAGIKLTPEMTKQLTDLAVKSAEAESELKKLRDSYEFAFDTAKGFATDFFDGIKNGESVWDSLKNAALNALDKISDKLLDMAMDGLLTNLLGGLFGGGASIGSVLASGGGGLFSNGGYTGPGGKYDPAGIVHAGEFVFSSEAVKAIGLGNLEAMHGAAKRGYAGGGYVGPAPAVARAGIAVANRAANSDSANTNAAPVVHNTYHIDARGAVEGTAEQIRKAIEQNNKTGVPQIAVQSVQRAQKHGVTR